MNDLTCAKCSAIARPAELSEGVCAFCRKRWSEVEIALIRFRIRHAIRKWSSWSKPWTAREEKVLLYLIKTHTQAEVARMLGRTVSAIRDRLYKRLYRGVKLGPKPRPRKAKKLPRIAAERT